jgi:alkanesulfonate monooxygenase SsuD/methylene tetrahydromethanopterin reductase-like flavin-dependent oxidoreductase (luciferase family)
MASGDRIRQRVGVPDYRHDLQFGVFITPVAGQADAVVELARLADVVGLDIVSFQDHPYQAAFLDTWTLLSVVAALTANVRVAPNVARARRRRVLGRDRGDRRAAAHARAVR